MPGDHTGIGYQQEARGTGIAKIVFNKLVQLSTPVFSTSVTYLIPIVALMWGSLDGEKFSWYQFLAAMLIVFGVYISNRKLRAKKIPPKKAVFSSDK